MTRRTKIVCTLGPTSNTADVIKNLIRAGMECARINFSHGTYDTHSETIGQLKAARDELGAPVSLLLDTRGPEIRIKTFKGNKRIVIQQGQPFTLTTRDVEGDDTIVSITYSDLPKDVRPGGRILIDDGLIELSIQEVTDTDIICQSVNSGFLSSRKGINVPDVYVNLPSITEKDIEDIKFGIRMGFDYIAASFVRSAKDVLAIRDVLDNNGGAGINVVAKIESRDGVNNLDSILEVSDGIMVARGDLGVEIPPEEVPLVQKELIRKANQMGKPVITATQMLESMVQNPRPTRAEANDVANAIFDGSDAIMLSGETANGKYPVEAVRMMARIAIRAEGAIDYHESLNQRHVADTVTNAISYATCTTAADLNAPCIVTITDSGFTARMVSKYKPTCPVLAVCSREMIMRQLNLVWGCVPIKNDAPEADIFTTAVRKSEETGLAKTGDPIVIVAGIPVGQVGSTNTIKVQIVGDVLVKGRGSGGKTVSGSACVLKVAEEAQQRFRPGDIIVIPFTTNKLLPFLRKCSGIVVGSDQAVDYTHAETVAAALEIPIVVCSERVIDAIPQGTGITLDSVKGFVYNGMPEAIN
ncbi:MAG: pyruvate kinase [Clostridiales bacterium]|jgi:pyruvate kinase|nr:pyruvate kinase [Clostridiales bacterium]